MQLAVMPPERSIVRAQSSSQVLDAHFISQTSSGSLQTDGQAGLNLLDFPKLPLLLIWQRICQLPMRDRRALLATCKAALGTFGEITDRMDRLKLILDDGTLYGLSDNMDRLMQIFDDGTFYGLTGRDEMLKLIFDGTTFHGPTDRIERSQLPQGGGARVPDHTPWQDQSWVPGWAHALKVLSWFPNATIGRLELCFASASGQEMLRSFMAAAAGRLGQVTALELNGPHIEVRISGSPMPFKCSLTYRGLGFQSQGEIFVPWLIA